MAERCNSALGQVRFGEGQENLGGNFVLSKSGFVLAQIKGGEPRGNGEVLICRKLVENIILIALACLVVGVRAPRASLYYGLFERRSSTLV